MGLVKVTTSHPFDFYKNGPKLPNLCAKQLLQILELQSGGFTLSPITKFRKIIQIMDTDF